MCIIGEFGKRYSTNIERIRTNTIMRRKRLFDTGEKRKKSTATRFSGPDTDYGLAEPLDNIITEQEFDIKKKLFLEKLKKIDRIELERITKEQSYSQDWYIERKKRLAASNFGDICKMRANTSCRKKVYSLLYCPCTTTKEMAYGIENEPRAKIKFESISQLSIKSCGLFVDEIFPFLASSPGIIIFSCFFY